MPSPILSVAQMRAWEQATWQTGIAEQSVIARVGEIVARRALAMSNDGAVCLALAGSGHNGDDVRLSMPHLKKRDVQLLEVADPSRQLPELARALERRPALIIDGLFGIGLNRPLDEEWKDFVERVNRSQVPVLAVDCPSGLNCETGQIEGAAIRAGVTLTLGAVKRGLIATSAVPYVGHLELASEIGLVPCPVETDLQWTMPDDFAGLPLPRKLDAHKGAFGHLVIVAGSLGYHGAAVLAARGAQAAHPGLISVVTTDEAFPPVATQLQSAMARPWTADWEPPEKTTAVLFGPGLADPTVPTGLRKQMVRLWQEFDGAVVADASGIDWLAGAGLHSQAPRVITPHPGEAAKLLNTDAKRIQVDRVGAVRKLSARVGGSLVVLKGYQSLVGGEDGPVHVNNTGGPMLGQGGSGDVLAGYLAGLLAQPAMARDPVRTTRFAVWRHGLAGEAERWNGMIDELPAQLAQR